MKLEATLLGADISRSGEEAKRLEEAGVDAVYTFEGPHDPFFPLVLAARETKTVELGTAIAIAFARNPMICANIANDLQQLTQGRFILGLGSQIKPHIEKRFSQTWSRPAARMREFVLAIRAIWRTWYEGEPLQFRGEFYTHTIMTPFFNPGPNPFGEPRIFLAAVGPRPRASEVITMYADHDVALGVPKHAGRRGALSEAEVNKRTAVLGLPAIGGPASPVHVLFEKPAHVQNVSRLQDMR